MVQASWGSSPREMLEYWIVAVTPQHSPEPTASGSSTARAGCSVEVYIEPTLGRGEREMTGGPSAVGDEDDIVCPLKSTRPETRDEDHFGGGIVR